LFVGVHRASKENRLKTFKWYYLFLVVAMAVFFTAGALHVDRYRSQTDYEVLRAGAEQRLQAEEERINGFLDKIEENFRLSPDFTQAHLRYLNTLTESIEGFSLYVYYRDSLRYWSSNKESFDPDEIDPVPNQHGVRLSNGYFEVFRRQPGEKLLVALFRIRNEFPIENQYLHNRFNEILGLPDRARLSPVANERIYPVHSAKGNVLFSLSFSAISDQTEQFEGEELVGILYLVGIGLFMVFAFMFTLRLLRTRPLAGLVTIIGIVLLRIAGIVYRVPESMYELA